MRSLSAHEGLTVCGKMKTFYLVIKAVPIQKKPPNDRAKGILASFWVLDKTPENALRRAIFYLFRHGYHPKDLEKEPVEITAEHYADHERELGLVNFQKAQRYGIAALFVGWKRE